jgi:hypothetical protein
MGNELSNVDIRAIRYSSSTSQFEVSKWLIIPSLLQLSGKNDKWAALLEPYLAHAFLKRTQTLVADLDMSLMWSSDNESWQPGNAAWLEFHKHMCARLGIANDMLIRHTFDDLRTCRFPVATFISTVLAQIDTTKMTHVVDRIINNFVIIPTVNDEEEYRGVVEHFLQSDAAHFLRSPISFQQTLLKVPTTFGSLSTFLQTVVDR